jgi:hypothetical protein
MQEAFIGIIGGHRCGNQNHPTEVSRCRDAALVIANLIPARCESVSEFTSFFV